MKSMMQSVKNLSARRVEAAKRKANEEDDEANKRKRIGYVINLLEAKKARTEQVAKDETSSLNDELKKLRASLKQ